MKSYLSVKAWMAVLMLCSCLALQAQVYEEEKPHWYFGMTGGYRFGSASVSNLDETIFPAPEGRNSGLFSIFAQYEWGRERQFAVRPELAFLTRGLRFEGIGKEFVSNDVRYSLKSKYVDIRVPIIYNIGKYSWNWRPYIYVAPIVGFSTAGRISLTSSQDNGYYEGYAMDLTDANMASTYFAAAVGAGLKYGLDINGSKCYLGIEADYEFGLTNTYSKKERDGEVIINSGLLYPAYNITGSRKFKGFELRASLSVPFSIFKKKQKPAPAPIVAAPVEPEPEPVVEVEEKPCCTLDEILSLISLGERVEGKTICAIDIIHFDFGKSSIKPSSYDYLNKIASLIIRTNVNMEIKGHTDNVGTPEFNMNLSKQRAEAVYDYLVGHGVSKSRLSYSYYGMTRPLGDNDTEEGRTMNRRVEFEIK